MNGSRHRAIFEVLRCESSFRLRQAEEALYSGMFCSWEAVSVLPKTLRKRLAEEVSWSTLSKAMTLSSHSDDSWKALLRTGDGHILETVLMRNARGQLTICVSSQIGCAMNCAFCATGKMGFVRNLSSDEIVDQVRFFRDFVRESDIEGKITNVVFMGMGEPLANYEAVREALHIMIDWMEIGKSRITVSTVGLLSALSHLLVDLKWPNVRLAISLHVADEVLRKQIMPSTQDGFLEELVSFSRAYSKRFPERRRHLTLEYLLLSNVNDRDEDIRKLVKLAHRMGKVRVNLIPYNATDSEFSGSGEERIRRFQDILERSGVTVTIRKSMGGDIEAACGQLAGDRVEGKKHTCFQWQAKSGI